MNKKIECLDPTCNAGERIERRQFSTWVAKAYFCTGCKRSFTVSTFGGKLRDIAPAVLGWCAIVAMGGGFLHHGGHDPANLDAYDTSDLDTFGQSGGFGDGGVS